MNNVWLGAPGVIRGEGADGVMAQPNSSPTSCPSIHTSHPAHVVQHPSHPFRTVPHAMSQPPSAKPADAGMEKLFSRLPGLIDQARKGTMQQQAIAQVIPRRIFKMPASFAVLTLR